MKLQYRNSEQTKTNIQESVSNSKSPEVLTNIDNIVCYKSRREELNKRVKSIIEQKRQTANAKN